jgi:hypothetical protein
MTRSTLVFAVSACLLVVTHAQAQDRVDRELDDSLRRTYEGEPAREPVPDYAAHEIEKERDRFQVTLRLSASAQAAYLRNLEIVGREGSSGGEVIELQDDDGRDFDLEGTLAVVPTVELNLGGYLALRGAATAAVWYGDENRVAAGQGFTFGDTTFASGQTVESEFGLFLGDVQIGAHVVTNRYVRLGLFGGARYMAWETTLERISGGSYVKEESRVEALVPTFTLTLDLSPTPWLEFYANGTVGGFAYESHDEDLVLINGTLTRIPERQRKATTLEAEGGLRLIFAGHFGIYAGYRVSHLRIEREVPEQKEGMKSLVHGPVAGLLFQF